MTIVNNFRDIAQKYDGFLFDLWGVLYEGENIFDEAIDVLKRLRALNKRVALVSNTPFSNLKCAEALVHNGLHSDLYDTVFTAGELCIQHVLSNCNSFKNFYVFDSNYWDTWEEIKHCANRVFDIENACSILGLAVPSGINSEQEIWEHCDDIFKLAIDRQLTFLCANPDMYVFVSNEPKVRPGLMAERYQKLGGKVIIFGKPFPEIFKSALHALEKPKKVLMVGDGESTDVLGATNLGIDSMLIINNYYDNVHVSKSRATYCSKKLQW